MCVQLSSIRTFFHMLQHVRPCDVSFLQCPAEHLDRNARQLCGSHNPSCALAKNSNR